MANQQSVGDALISVELDERLGIKGGQSSFAGGESSMMEGRNNTHELVTIASLGVQAQAGLVNQVPARAMFLTSLAAFQPLQTSTSTAARLFHIRRLNEKSCADVLLNISMDCHRLCGLTALP